LAEFCFKNKSKGLYQAYCKLCKRDYNKVWYSNETNRTNQIARASKNNATYLEEAWRWKIEYVAENGGCSWDGCDIDNPVMIEFDHIDRSDKTQAISTMIARGRPLSAIKEEAKKCRLLCANHHRLWTAEQMNYKIYTLML
jgi:hypothetical protein